MANTNQFRILAIKDQQVFWIGKLVNLMNQKVLQIQIKLTTAIPNTNTREPASQTYSALMQLSAPMKSMIRSKTFAFTIMKN